MASAFIQIKERNADHFTGAAIREYFKLDITDKFIRALLIVITMFVLRSINEYLLSNNIITPKQSKFLQFVLLILLIILVAISILDGDHSNAKN
ncbi:hypothetical protein QJ48_18420 [Paenibacillus sp. A3]|nr:hypothetical protein QJ48_18420 [Paenibacillus sp. A3]